MQKQLAGHRQGQGHCLPAQPGSQASWFGHCRPKTLKAVALGEGTWRNGWLRTVKETIGDREGTVLERNGSTSRGMAEPRGWHSSTDRRRRAEGAACIQ